MTNVRYREVKYVPSQQDVYIPKDPGMSGSYFQVWETHGELVKGVLVGVDLKTLIQRRDQVGTVSIHDLDENWEKWTADSLSVN
jgi:hypothetical protein